MSSRYPDLIDAADTDLWHPRKNHMEMDQQQAFRYAISLPGVAGAYAWRMPELFLRGFLVFYVRGDEATYGAASVAEPEFLCHMKEQQHYLPMDRSLSTLPAAIRWAQSHDEQARRIAERGQAFMRSRYNASHIARVLASRLAAAPHHVGMACPSPCRRVTQELW